MHSCRRIPSALILSFIVLPLLWSVSSPSYADVIVSPQSIPLSIAGGGGGSGTATPDLFTGSLGTSIPIEVPPGRKGMDPGLALVYHSNNGNGWVGMGWELEVGAIERQITSGVNYSGDNYLLRMGGATADLVRISGTAPGDGEFRPKIEGAFNRIQKIGAYWQVTDKTGKRFLFGQTTASRQTVSAGTFRWSLDQVSDTDGNYMTLSYVTNQGQLYLDRIDYTGCCNPVSPTLPTTNYVKFYTESRTDAPTMYTINFPVTMAYRLKQIDIFSNGQYPGGTRVRTYVLTYGSSASTRRSELTKVQQTDKNGTSGLYLPAITINYKTDPSPSTFTTGPAWFSSYCGTADIGSADFNGDGYADMWCRQSNNNLFILLSNGNNAFYVTNSGNWGTTCGGSVGTGDFDGDGRADIWCRKSNNDLLIFLSNGSTFYVTPGNNGIWGAACVGSMGTGDFDGDGKTDIWCRQSNNNLMVLLSTGTSFTNANNPWYSNWCLAADIGSDDFNGDGKADIWCRNGNNDLRVLLSTGHSFTIAPGDTTDTWYSNWCTANYFGTADFNGDGKADVWCRNANGDVRVLVSTGNSFTIAPGSTSDTWKSGWCTAVAVGTADFNGDGKADMWCRGAGYNVFVLLSTGTNPFTDAGTWMTACVGSISTGDFNGDGKSDMWCRQANNNILISTSGTILGTTDLLSALSNGLGGLTTVTYTPSTTWSPWTTPGYLPFPIQTVSAISTCDKYSGSGTTCLDTPSTTSINYAGGFYHLQQREFRGFYYNQVAGPIGPNGEQTRTQTWFLQGNSTNSDDPFCGNAVPCDGYMKGKPYYVQVIDGQSHIFSQTQTSYAPDSTAPYFNPPLQVDSYTCDGTSTTTCGSAKHAQVIYTYENTYGNLIQTSKFGDVSVTGDERYDYIDYTANPSAWIVVPSHLYTVAADTTTIVAQSWLTYDNQTPNHTSPPPPTLGHLTTVEKWLNTATSNPTTTLTYDTYGNLLSTQDANGHITTECYDASATFAESAQNALQQATQTQYYGVSWNATCGTAPPALTGTGLYGQVGSVTDPNSQTAQTSYDTFGRKTLVTLPDTSWTSYAYNSFGTVGTQNVQTSTAAGLSSWNYFDGLGRTILTKATGPDGKLIDTQTTYNTTGTKHQTSLPYFDGGTPLWSVSTYDALNRLIKTVNPDNSTITASYSPWVTTAVDANGHQKRQTHDAYGRVIEVDEFTGVSPSTTLYAITVYAYDVLGNLVSTTDTKGNKTTMRYDTMGRKIAMSDPDMGNCGDLTTVTPNTTFPWYAAPCWNYQYDAVGNLLQQSDAKGQNIYFHYDALNRTLQRDLGTWKILGYGDVGYTYDTLLSGFTTPPNYQIGRLVRVIDSSGVTRFGYDAMGRIRRTDKLVDSILYITTTSYDLAGRPTSISYPDGSAISYAYNGPLLSQVYDATTTYAQYTGYNALGQPASAAYGNGVTTNYTYANSGNSACPQQSFRLCTVQTGTTVTTYQSLQYGYDSMGNVKTIADALPTFGMHTNQTQSFGYDEQDRLTSATGPYAPTTPIAYAYDQIGNMTCNSYLSACTASSPNYVYNDPLHIHAVTSVTNTAGRSYGYDLNGNMNARGGDTLTYDLQNRLISYAVNGGSTTTFGYDGDGGRVKKSNGVSTTVYIGKLFECVAPCYSGGVWSGTKHIFAGANRIASKPITTTGDISYYHTDHLHSTSVITDKNGADQSEYVYLPYGDTYLMSGPTYHYLFTGQEKDFETGLYFYGARYYDAALGRFISADTVVPQAFDPQALNRYAYVRDNPINLIDPSGHSWLSSALHHLFGHIFDWARKHATLMGLILQFVAPEAIGLLANTVDSVLGALGQLKPLVEPLVPALQAAAFVTGGYLLKQSPIGRYILSAEMIVVTAVLAFFCDICATVTIPGIGTHSVATVALAQEVAFGGEGVYGAIRAGGDPSAGLFLGVSSAAEGAIGGLVTGPVLAGLSAGFSAIGSFVSSILPGPVLGIAGAVGSAMTSMASLTGYLFPPGVMPIYSTAFRVSMTLYGMISAEEYGGGAGRRDYWIRAMEVPAFFGGIIAVGGYFSSLPGWGGPGPTE